MRSIELYEYIISKARGNRDFFELSNREMQKDLGISERSATYFMRALTACGAVSVITDYNGGNRRMVKVNQDFRKEELPKHMTPRNKSKKDASSKLMVANISGWSQTFDGRKLSLSDIPTYKITNVNQYVDNTCVYKVDGRKQNVCGSPYYIYTDLDLLKIKLKDLDSDLLVKGVQGEKPFLNDQPANAMFAPAKCATTLPATFDESSTEIAAADGELIPASAPARHIPAKRTHAPVKIPQSWEELVPLVEDWIKRHESTYPDASSLLEPSMTAEKFFNYWDEHDWLDGRGKPVKSLKGRISTWCLNELRYNRKSGVPAMPKHGKAAVEKIKRDLADYAKREPEAMDFFARYAQEHRNDDFQ